ncbi:hypothetical protein ARMSODRAFT_162368 [Armillaria solidipes]|uniref:Uncharacterized protein n=1 Tax=Armillaria solidipes TaxID=1076256 RepID=A0A2H3C292_9AGAR|nr:hypothetical protein ARMSODRAFT_162368 [Armillaria solidipes]
MERPPVQYRCSCYLSRHRSASLVNVWCNEPQERSGSFATISMTRGGNESLIESGRPCVLHPFGCTQTSGMPRPKRTWHHPVRRHAIWLKFRGPFFTLFHLTILASSREDNLSGNSQYEPLSIFLVSNFFKKKFPIPHSYGECQNVDPEFR